MFFKQQYFDLLGKYQDHIRDKEDAEQNEAYEALKEANDLTKVWAEALIEKLFSNGHLGGFRNRPTNQGNKFKPYTWAKIYPRKNAPKQLAYTVGIEARMGFIVKIDTVGEIGTQRNKYENLRGDFGNQSPIVSILSIEEGIDKSLDELVDWSMGEIQKFGLSYDDVCVELDLKSNDFTAQQVLDYLKSRYSNAEQKTQKIFVCINELGKELALETGNLSTNTIRVFLKDQPPEQIIALEQCKFRGIGDSPNHNLNSNTNTLRVNDSFYQINPSSLDQLQKICDWYDEISIADHTARTPNEMELGKEMDNEKQALNRILFGAAGTGKTYHTINHALSIIENKSLEELGEQTREELKKRFDDYKEKGQIKFVTFHQSFSYEDFVEGIRANTDENGNLTYDVQAGIFKEICNDAKENKNTLKDLGVRPNAEIWKLSIGDLATRQYCFDHGQIRVGWGQTGDLLDEDTKSTESYQQFSSTDHHTLDQFVSGVEVGDVVLCLKGVNEICGVAVVRDDYFFDKNHPEGVREDYLHCRNVNWILKDISFNIRELNGGIGLTLKTMYRLWRFTWADLLHELNKVGYLLDNKVEEKLDPYILIIDEINRGNISRIFGELITLIEDSKRAGADEELSVTLPYSKKEFTVPQNVYIIGTMNSSDRSLTGLDIALRRRFTFIEMPPQPELLNSVSVEGVDIEKLLKVINQRIEVLLDRDHCIGHANFMHLKEQPTLNNLSAIFKQKIIPQLQEYFFDDWSKINMVLNNNGMLKAEPQQKSSMFPNANIDDLGYFEDKKTWELVPSSFNAIESFAKIIQH